MPSTIVVVKTRHDHVSGYSHNATGLQNSAGMFVAGMKLVGADIALVTAVDGNCLDRLITEAGAQNVILEALWCPPYKIAELRRLHPNVHWYVRIHSDTPFLSQEGMSIDWLYQYAAHGVCILPNDERTARDLEAVGRSVWIPNYFPLDDARPAKPATSGDLNVGSFGAIRSMKNYLRAAFVARELAADLGRPLKFHINAERIEGGWTSENLLKNLRSLLGDSLVEHGWMDRPAFLDVMAGMDICIVPSVSETFNIVAADSVLVGVPVVGSAEIAWLPRQYVAGNHPEELYRASRTALRSPRWAVWTERGYLASWNRAALRLYRKLLGELEG